MCVCVCVCVCVLLLLSLLVQVYRCVSVLCVLLLLSTVTGAGVCVFCVAFFLHVCASCLIIIVSIVFSLYYTNNDNDNCTKFYILSFPISCHLNLSNIT